MKRLQLQSKARPRRFGDDAPPRGWHELTFLGREYYVRDGYELSACCGQAHENPHIDNCSQCMPMWGVLVVASLGEEASEARNRAQAAEEQRD